MTAAVIYPSVLPSGDAHASLSSIMALFLIVSVPVWCLLIVSFYRTPSRGWRSLFLPFLGGMLIGMAAITITLGLLTRTPFSMNLSELYRWAWLRGPGWPMIISVPIVLFKYQGKPTSYSRIREIAAWLSGTAFVYMFWYAVTPDPGFDFYRLLFMPFLWLGSIGSVTWLADRGLRLDGWIRYLLFASAGLSSSLFILLPVFYTMGDAFYSFAISILLTASSTFLLFMDSRGRLN